MDIVTDIKQKNKRYLPHELTTKINSVKLYRQTKDIDFVLRRYHISKASLMRWNRLYDGTKESLVPKSHRPHSQHPNAHTEEELSFSWRFLLGDWDRYGQLKIRRKAYIHLAACLFHPGAQCGQSTSL